MKPIIALSQLVMLAAALVASTLLIALLLVPGVFAGTSTVGWAQDVLDVPPLPDTITGPAERSVIYASDGTVLATLHGVENRRLVDYEDIPNEVINAVVATEDRGFFEHRGVDHTAIVRAAISNIQAGGVAEGGSTITQQLVKMVVLTPEVSLDRKTTEIIYAVQLEEEWTKEEILTAYLNEAYFGRGVYGIETAAEHYFGRTAAELEVHHAAMLAGLLRSPEGNNPVTAPEQAIQRRNIVITQMFRAGYLTIEEHDEARARELEIDLSPLPAPTEPFYVEWVKQQLFEDHRLGTDRQERATRVLRGGLHIHTTLDPNLQDLAETAVANWVQDPEVDPLASIVSVEPESGAVKALALGPKTFGECSPQEREEWGYCPFTKVNPTVPGGGGSGRQVGSSYKPFVLAAAIERGTMPDYRTSTSSREFIPGCRDGSRGWYPRNYGGSGGGVRDMQWAITRSNNVYHAKLAGIVGPNRLADTSLRLGIDTPELRTVAAMDDDAARNFCSISLGAVDAFPIDVTAGYATFANGGAYCEPYAISHVTNRNNNRVLTNDPACQPAIEPAVAAHLNTLLQGTTGAGGTGRAAALDRPHAGKTGTTNDNRDAWFVGYTPQLATSAWIGFEQPAPLTNLTLGGTAWRSVTGGTVPARMWHDFMEPALEQYEPLDFAKPPPVQRATVPDVEGLVLADATERLLRADLRVETTTRRSWRPDGHVYRQSLTADREVAYGTRITLTISDGQVEIPTMPDAVGEDANRIVSQMRSAGWNVRTVELTTQVDRLDQTVARQSRPPGDQPERTEREDVTLHIYRLPPPPPPPPEPDDSEGETPEGEEPDSAGEDPDGEETTNSAENGETGDEQSSSAPSEGDTAELGEEQN